MSLEDDVVRLATRLARYSGTDEVTGLSNLRQLLRELKRELARAQRTHESLHLLVIEPDSAVDPGVLARRVTSLIRDEDIAARIGGLCLALVLCDSRGLAAGSLAARLQQEVGDLATLSIGARVISQEEAASMAPVALLQQAMEALKMARSRGGNTLQIWEQGPQSLS